MRLLLCIALLVATEAQADPVRFEAGLGKCKYGAEGNGIWYVEQYPHTLDMTAGCGFVGISKIERSLGPVGIGWRFGYANLGVAHVDAVFPMRDEEHYKPVMDGSDCNQAVSHFGCLGRGVGSQRAQGLTFGAIAEVPVKSLVLGAEFGAFVYEGVFKVDVTKYPSGSYPDADWLHPRWGGWRVTPYVGATAQWGWVFASARQYHGVHAREEGCAHCTGVASGAASQWTLGVSVPIQ